MYQQTFITLLPISVSDPESGWANAHNSLVEDGSVASTNIGSGGPGPIGDPLVFSFSAGALVPPEAVITGVAVNGKCSYSGTEADGVWMNATLVKGAVNYSPTTNETPSMFGTLTWISSGGAGDLWAGVWTPSDFNNGSVTLSLTGEQHVGDGTGTVGFDAASLTVFYTLTKGDSDMDFYHAAEEAGWQVLFEEALPSLSSAAGLFPAFSNSTNKSKVVNATYVLVTLRGAGITYRGDGNTPTAGANGIDLPIGGPYEFSVTESEGVGFQAVQNGGSASGWIQYWGLKGVTG